LRQTQQTTLVFLLGAMLILGVEVHAGQITLEDFALSAKAIAPGESFEVSARAVAVDIPRVSFVLRTIKPLPRKKAPPTLTHYDAGRGFANLTENDGVHLPDNGDLDLDVRPRHFKVRLSTKGWLPGRYDLALFAHNRPGSGLHVVDQHGFAVIVEKDTIRLEDTGRISPAKFAACTLSAREVAAGEAVELSLAATASIEGVEIHHSYPMAVERVPPGFFYDLEEHTSSYREEGHALVRDGGALDLDPAPKQMRVRFDTSGWLPGPYFLQVSLVSPETGQRDLRNLAFRVRSPGDAVDVEVSENWVLCPGTHSERMARLDSGVLLYTSFLSRDEGATWEKRETGTLGPGPLALSDGRIIGMAYRSKPIEGRTGWYRDSGYVSNDQGLTVEAQDVDFHVPLAKAARGHALHLGPLYMRSMVERPDGSLVALMAGWFLGDDVPCPYSPKRPYSRTYTCESIDGGATWTYLATIGYGQIGSEGYNEGSMKQLPNGDLVVVMRTGSMADKRCHDNPIMFSRSRDGGKRWSTPQRTGVNGAFPDILVLSDGVLALSYGRPGACIMFSTDGGATWGDQTVVDATPYSGYTTIVETGPGEILMAFGTRGYMDPKAGKQPDAVRLARVRYKVRTATKDTDAFGLLRSCGAVLEDLGDGFYEATMPAKALGRDEKYTLHLPEGYDAHRAEAYPLIVFLHGAGRTHRTLVDAPKIRAAIEGSKAVVLLPNGGGSWWVDSPNEASSPYQQHLSELIGTITRALNVSTDPAQRALGGWSMGGFGSANYMADYPADFGAWGGIIALVDFPNPAYPVEQNHTIPEVLGEAADWPGLNPIQKADAFKGKRIQFITSADAFDRKMNEAFAAKLKEEGIPHTFEIIEGAHTFEVVEQAFPEIMAFFEAR
jgi:S-formylglutathione hydrolase FrmB